MKPPPVKTRFGKSLNQKILLENIPPTAKAGCVLLFNKFVKLEILPSWEVLINEFEFIARIPNGDYQENYTFYEICIEIIKDLSWHAFLSLIERIYILLKPQYRMISEFESEISISLTETQTMFADEFNSLFEEENLGYVFKNGIFWRKGRPQTQKNIMKMGSILSDSRLEAVRIHYSKSLDLFEKKEPDFENSIKECVCSLEAFLEIKFGKEYDKGLRKLSGKIVHPTIISFIEKIIAFRGDSRGVAHPAINSLKVDSFEGELILNLVAGIISYLYDKIVEQERVPF